MSLDGFQPIERKEWVPDQHAHRHFATFDIKPEGDEIDGRRLLMWNNDVEISLCRPATTMDYFFRNGEGDEVVFVHEGRGVLETIFGDVPYKEGEYVVIPRGTTYRFQPAPRLPEAASASGPGVGGSAADASSLSPQRYLVFETPGLIEIPRRYRNFVRLLFLDSGVRGRYDDWPSMARICVAFLRRNHASPPVSPIKLTTLLYWIRSSPRCAK